MSISNWFYGCENLRTVETLPEGVQDLSIAFCGCGKLSSLPELPGSVTDLDEAFIGCGSLTAVPIIPKKVIYTCGTFVDCRRLSGHLLLTGRLKQCAYMFQNACTEPDAELVIDYLPGLEDVADAVIATASAGSKVLKGEVRTTAF